MTQITSAQITTSTDSPASSSYSSGSATTTVEYMTTTTTNTSGLLSNDTEGGLDNLLDVNTTIPSPTSSPLLTSPILQTKLPVILNATSPEFIGWPLLETGITATKANISTKYTAHLGFLGVKLKSLNSVHYLTAGQKAFISI